MAVSKRLRYEILRRDNHTCRYCGGVAPDVVLTVDHVQPTALGGSDLPENLVAACKDCNSGKTSAKPDDGHVAAVSEDALKWAGRMRKLLADAAIDILALQEQRDAFLQAWEGWTFGGVSLEPPADWRQSVDQWNALDVPREIIEYAIETSMTTMKVKQVDKWRYMCGVIWRKIDEASKKAGAEPAPATEWTDGVSADEQRGWSLAFDMLAYNDFPNRCLVGHVDGFPSTYMKWVA